MKKTLPDKDRILRAFNGLNLDEIFAKLDKRKCACPEGYHNMFENCRGY